MHPFYENQMSEKQMAFVNCAVDFRRRELLMEGGRWFDIKRFDIEITHEAYQTGARMCWHVATFVVPVQIPEEVISYGVVPNPGKELW